MTHPFSWLPSWSGGSECRTTRTGGIIHLSCFGGSRWSLVHLPPLNPKHRFKLHDHGEVGTLNLAAFEADKWAEYPYPGRPWWNLECSDSSQLRFTTKEEAKAHADAFEREMEALWRSRGYAFPAVQEDECAKGYATERTAAFEQRMKQDWDTTRPSPLPNPSWDPKGKHAKQYAEDCLAREAAKLAAEIKRRLADAEQLERSGICPTFEARREGYKLIFFCPACQREHSHGAATDEHLVVVLSHSHTDYPHGYLLREVVPFTDPRAW
jgi:hypothetical protein